MGSVSLCALPPLFSDQPIDPGKPGTSVTRPFQVLGEKSYPLKVAFEFPSIEARLKDQIVGARHGDKCQGDIRYEEIPEAQRKGLGQPIPYRVVVRKAADRFVVLDRTFFSLCRTSNGNNSKTRTIGWLPFAEEDDIAEITNLEAQSSLPCMKTTISLVAGQGRKFCQRAGCVKCAGPV